MLSLTSIRDLVGVGAFLRGRAYADSGAVLSYEVLRHPGGVELVGRVQGGGLRPYEVSVDILADAEGTRLTDGDCTCPVGLNCKHVAAILIRAATAPAGPASLQPQPKSWVDALRPFLRDPAPDKPVVGLQFEVVHSNRGTAITMRPVVRGAKDRWVRTGIGWSGLGYHKGRAQSPSAFRLLDEIQALLNASQRQNVYTSAQSLDLTSFPSARVWSVLASAAAAGLPLVRSGLTDPPVVLAAEPARVTMDFTRAGPVRRLQPSISGGGEVLRPGQFLLLGIPAHGVAWWDRTDRGSGPLHLAALERELDDQVHGMVAHRGEIELPEADLNWFLRDMYPALRRRLWLISSDGSAEFPEPSPPRLAVRAAYGPGRTADVEWVWRYAIGDAVRELAVDVPADTDPDRDADAEAKLLVEACAAVDAMPELLASDKSAPRLAPRARLTGDDALVGLAGVLAGLADLPGFDVDSSGEFPRLRAASGAPGIEIDGEPFDRDWFDLKVQVRVDGEVVPFGEIFAAVAEGQRYLILPSGLYFDLHRPELQVLHEVIAESRALADPGPATARVSRYQLGLWDELRKWAVASVQAEVWAESVAAVAGLGSVDEVEVPASLRATLRPYQRAGFAWLAFLHSHRLGGVLADDMGLGKTVQSIALMCHVRERNPGGPPFLVVAPTSVVGNWAAELARFAPHLSVATVTATGARRGASLQATVAGADVVVTSYALLRLESSEYEGVEWEAMILDEAQAVKNHAAKAYQCVRGLPVPVKFAITGTPMENNLMELWATFSLVAPGLLGDTRRFADHYRLPIERGDRDRLEALRSRIAPLMMRRRKEEVAAELPEKIEQAIRLELAPRHRRAYDTLLARERQRVLGLLHDFDRNRIAILRSLTLLRQAALDVSLVDDEFAGVPATKLDALLETLTEVVAEGHRVLVFSQFTRFLGRVRERLDAAGIGYCYLDGGTRDRAEVVGSFNSGAAPVFLLSLKAGGVGLNLTSADYCIVLDPWWNPATEAQAVDRAHRIGQTRTVMVYRLVAKDTIEETVMRLKDKKARLFAGVLDGGDYSGAALTADDIRSLLM